MNRSISSAATLLCCSLVTVGCGETVVDESKPPGSSAGAASTAAPEASSSATMTGGASAAPPLSTSTVNDGAGGNTAVGGGSLGGAGGTGGGTGAGGQLAEGGSANGGAGGQSAGGGGPLLVDASSGCGKPAPPGGSAADPIELGANRYYVKVPPSYDPGRPYPLLFVFHPSNNPIDWAEKNSGFEEAGARGAAIIVYPGSAGKGWEAADVVLFEPLYQQLTENYCVDLARVFAAGESSGGDYSSILGCEFGDKLTAIGPCATKAVAAYPLEVAKRACKGSVSAVIIHGVRDSVVGAENGPATRDFYQTLNQCAPTSTPVDGYTDDQSNCVKFDGCAAERATYWCQHNDPNYGNTNHGWPAFAGKMLWEHFSSF